MGGRSLWWVRDVVVEVFLGGVSPLGLSVHEVLVEMFLFMFGE